GIRDFHVTGVQTCALPILTEPATGRRHCCSSRATSPRRTWICSAVRSPARRPASAGERVIVTGSFLAAAALVLLLAPLVLTAGQIGRASCRDRAELTDAAV